MKHTSRKKPLITIAMLFTILLSVFILPTAAQAFSGGDGSDVSPFLISSCEDFKEIDDNFENFTKEFKLTTDLDCTSDGNDIITAVGEDSFRGTLDGNNHSITVNINIGWSYVGLIGYTNSATIENLTVKGTLISTSDYIGGLVGGSYNSTYSNVHSQVNVTGRNAVGGILGYSEDDISFDNSSATGSVTGNSYLGGFIGEIEGSATINNSFATGNVSSSGDDTSSIGGFIGYSEADIDRSYSTGNVTVTDTDHSGIGGFIGNNRAEVTKSYSTGSVSADNQNNNVGGFIGFNDSEIYQNYSTGNVTAGTSGGNTGGFAGGNSGYIYDSYSRGDVTGYEYVGGFVGYSTSGELLRTYSTGHVSANDHQGGYIGDQSDTTIGDSFFDQDTAGTDQDGNATPKSTVEMKKVATFTDTTTVGLDNAWDFVGTKNDDNQTNDIWDFISGRNDNYPVFVWQNLTPITPPDPPTPPTKTNSQTTTDTPTGKKVTLQWTGNCDLDSFNVKAEANKSKQDIAFDYPNGLANFTLKACEGSSIKITLTYYGISNASFVLRKYTPANGAYTTINEAQLNATNIDGTPAIVATYTLVDNGPLDTNPTPGIISDPVGLAHAILGAPRTGAGGTSN